MKNKPESQVDVIMDVLTWYRPPGRLGLWHGMRADVLCLGLWAGNSGGESAYFGLFRPSTWYYMDTLSVVVWSIQVTVCNYMALFYRLFFLLVFILAGSAIHICRFLTLLFHLWEAYRSLHGCTQYRLLIFPEHSPSGTHMAWMFETTLDQSANITVTYLKCKRLMYSFILCFKWTWISRRSGAVIIQTVALKGLSACPSTQFESIAFQA